MARFCSSAPRATPSIAALTCSVEMTVWLTAVFCWLVPLAICWMVVAI